MYFRFPCAPLVRSNPLHGSRISTIASLRSPKTRNLHSITATAQLLPTPIYYISADVPARMLHRMTGISSTRLHPPPQKGFLQSRRSIPTRVLTVFSKLPTVFPKVLSVFSKVLTVFSKVLTIHTTFTNRLHAQATSLPTNGYCLVVTPGNICSQPNKAVRRSLSAESGAPNKIQPYHQ